MRAFVRAIRAHARGLAPGFVVVPQNGQDLLAVDGAPVVAYLEAIDAQAREDLFYGYAGDGIPDLGVGHGTFVASLVARCATGAKILPIRIADDEGRGTSLAAADGLRYAIEAGARVINVSFHLDTTSALVQYWLEVAEKKGVVVVCAAGNEGLEYVSFFAKAATTLSVGAVDDTDRRAAFSNYGPGVDVYAPGVSVRAAYGTPTAGQLGTWCGTSFSAAFVSGAAALVWQRHPTWTPADVRAALRAAVDTALPLEKELMCGGRINLGKAATL
jgi:subtilisin family serine protease